MPLLGPGDPFDLSGIKFSTPETMLAQQQAQQAAQAGQIKLTQEQMAAQRQQEFRGQLGELSKSPSSAGYTQLLMKYPEFAEGLTPVIKQMGSQEAAKDAGAFQGQALPAYMAFLNKRPDLAASHLDDLATAYANSGNGAKAQQIAMLAKAARENPDVASGTLGGMLAASMGHENYDAMLKGAGFLTDEQKKAGEIAKLDAETLKEKALTKTDDDLRAGRVTEQQAKAQREKIQARYQEQVTQAGIAKDQGATVEAFAKAREADAGAGHLGAQTRLINDTRDSAIAEAAGKAKQATAQGRVADRLANAGADTAEAGAAMSKFGLLNAQGDLDRRRQTELLKIKELENKTGAEFDQQKAAAAANLQKITFDQNAMREGLAQKWEQLQLEKDKHAAAMMEVQRKAGELSDSARADVNLDVKGAMDSIGTAQNADRLIQKVRDNLDYGGAAGWGAEQWRSFWGRDEQATAVRRDLNAFTMKEVLKNIPPGSLTEKEQDIIRRGFPTDYSNPQLIMDWLQDKRDVARKAQSLFEASAAWKSNNKGVLGAAREPFTIGEKKIPKGMTFLQFAKEQRELEELHSMGAP